MDEPRFLLPVRLSLVLDSEKSFEGGAERLQIYFLLFQAAATRPESISTPRTRDAPRCCASTEMEMPLRGHEEAEIDKDRGEPISHETQPSLHPMSRTVFPLKKS